MLKGEKPHRIQVEMMGGKAGNIEKPLAAPLQEGASVVLLLVTQPGSEAFVPYLGSAFPVENDQVLLGAGAAERLSNESVAIKGDRISLDALGGLIKNITKAEAKSAEPGLEELQYPPVLEMPADFEGGGQSVAPDAGAGSAVQSPARSRDSRKKRRARK